ncbi:hypothetical protein [Glutamicibacter sp. NPDC087673]|uniref:hypothetical protein n=1 Tax=Glutamicibacter sp. NPDC087673 TaxID=3363997 RepID=UPI00381D9954
MLALLFSTAVPANASVEDSSAETTNTREFFERTVEGNKEGFLAPVEDQFGNSTFTGDESMITVVEETITPSETAATRVLKPIIRCSLDIQYVHGSHHVAGTINGVAVITCKNAATNKKVNASKLTLHYSLVRTKPNYKQWGAPAVSKTNKPTIRANRAVSCKEGPADFRGWAQGVLVAPPGYKLDGPAKYSAYGKTTGVACGLKASIAPVGIPAESIELTFVPQEQ